MLLQRFKRAQKNKLHTPDQNAARLSLRRMNFDIVNSFCQVTASFFFYTALIIAPSAAP